MKRKKDEQNFVPHVTHIMADGTRRDSIEGYPVPYNSTTAITYHILAKHMRILYEKAAEEERLKNS